MPTDPMVKSELLADGAVGWNTPYKVAKHHPGILSYYNGVRDKAATALAEQGLTGWLGYNAWKNRKKNEKPKP